jgi:Family of unknown function (DUF6152)
MNQLKLRRIVLGGSLWILNMVLPTPALAHHSVQAEFDIRKTFTITGTIAKIEEINPHSFMTLNVKDASGSIQKWAFEFGGPGQLRKAGLARDGLKAGDQVTIKALAAKDGSMSGLLQELTLPDGRVLKLGSEPLDGDKDGSAK